MKLSHAQILTMGQHATNPPRLNNKADIINWIIYAEKLIKEAEEIPVVKSSEIMDFGIENLKESYRKIEKQFVHIWVNKR